MFQSAMFSHNLLSATGGTKSYYWPAPFKCVIKSFSGACQLDPGDAETITIKDSSDTIGTLTFGSSIAAGAQGTWAADATNGKRVFDAGDNIIFEMSQCTAASEFLCTITLDPFARTTD